MQTEHPELPSMDPRVVVRQTLIFLKKKKVVSGYTRGTGVGNTAIGPSSPHPGIQNLTSITAT